MQDKEKYRDQPDDFSELIRQKVENHRIPVEADCWDEIELRMKPKRRPVTWWLAGSAAVAAILLILLFFPQGKDEGLYLKAVQADKFIDFIPSSALNNKKELTENKNEKQDIKKFSGSVRLISQQASKAISEKDGSSGTTQPVENSLLMIDSVQLASIGNSLTIADPDNESDLPVADSVPSQIKKEIRKEEKPTKILIEKTRKQDKWLLAASFSSGGSSSIGGGTQKSYDFLSSLPPALEDASSPEDYGSKFLSYEEFSSVNHSMPISFGLSVRKNLNDRVGVEAGLMYTYLSSKFNNGGHARAKQELHYLGIPVNVVVYIWNNPNWSIYASAGGMAEKGLRMNLTQSVYQGNNPPSELSVKKSIDGLQWSINASIGISYKFYQNWGLYFEPRYSYFFDNNQPYSIRTENSQTFGLSAGLRYEF